MYTFICIFTLFLSTTHCVHEHRISFLLFISMVKTLPLTNIVRACISIFFLHVNDWFMLHTLPVALLVNPLSHHCINNASKSNCV